MSATSVAQHITPRPEVILRDRRPFSRGLLSATVAVLVAGLVYSFATSSIEWSVVGDYLFSPRIFEGLGATLWLWVIALVLGVLIGFALAMMQIAGTPVV